MLAIKIMNKSNDQILSKSLRALTETEFKNRIIKKYKNIEWNQIAEILREISNLKRKSEEYAIKYRKDEIIKTDIINKLAGRSGM